MTTLEFIEKNKTNSLKKGDKVMMYDCLEASLHKDKTWVCKTDSYLGRGGNECVFLEDYSGCFSVCFLIKVAKK